MDDLASLLRDDEENSRFSYLDPPFAFNAPDVSRYPAEVTGYYLLRSMCRRLGWASLDGKRIIDYGCGVRFAKTIVNLTLDVGFYSGVDNNAQSIAWLNSNIHHERLRFVHLDMGNPMYNPDGKILRDAGALEQMGLTGFDVACMFSVLTHQNPDEAEAILLMLNRCVVEGGNLYFTAFVDENIQGYAERDPAVKRHISTYHPALLLDLLARTGWLVSDVYRASPLQEMAFVCRR